MIIICLELPVHPAALLWSITLNYSYLVRFVGYSNDRVAGTSGLHQQDWGHDK